MERRGEAETFKTGDGVSSTPRDSVSHILPLSPSPRPPVSPSPHPPVSVSPHPPVSLSPRPPVSASPLPPVSPDLRILLWDIDGTLIRSVRSGSYKDYFIPAIEGVFGTSGQLGEMKVSGMTDFQIIAEALKHEGFTHEHVREQMNRIKEHYMDAMHKVISSDDQFFEVIAGVPEALSALAKHPRYHSALLTGNIEPAAHLKMKLVGLADFFTLPGAFGDESHDRRDLPASAADRIRNYLQLDLAPEQFIVIGDTPNDIACARHFGARALAVETGRFYNREEILACEPDALLPDLTDVDLVLETLGQL